MPTTREKVPGLYLVTRHTLPALEDQDDAHYQEGASRFRSTQIDYERHTCDEDALIADVEESLSRWRLIWRVISALIAGAVMTLALLRFAAWLAPR